jgi:hypothetical protein
VQDSLHANVVSGSNLLDLQVVQQSCSALRIAARIAQYAQKSDLVLVLHNHVAEVIQQKIVRPTFEERIK